MEKNNKGLYILLVILFLLVIILFGYVLYDKVLSNKVEDTPIEDKKVDLENRNIEIPSDIYGTYYNNVKYGGDYTGEYFILNSDGKAVVVFSTCSDGLFDPKEISYRIININESLVLELDVNNNNSFGHRYLISKDSNGYRFKAEIPGCSDEPDSYFVSKLD